MTKKRVYAVLGLVLLVYTLAGIYSSKTIFILVSNIYNINDYLFYLIYLTLFLTTMFIFISHRVKKIKIKRLSIIISHYLFAIFTYNIIFTTILKPIIAIFKLIGLNKSLILRELYYIFSALILLFITMTLIKGYFNAKKITIKRYYINLSHKLSSRDIIKIALISDIHLGYIYGSKELNEIVLKLNNLNPDLVLLSGDIFDDDYYSLDSPDKVKDAFKNIDSTYGVYACLGNHDSGDSYDEMVSLLKDSGIKVLEDDKVIIDNKITLIGRIDPMPLGYQKNSRSTFPNLTKSDRELPVIVMEHNPITVDEYNGSDVDLMVSGHTHKGQFFPFNLVTNKIFSVDYGYYKKDEFSPHVIVTSGVGTWGPPIRVFTNSEIVEINVRI